MLKGITDLKDFLYTGVCNSFHKKDMILNYDIGKVILIKNNLVYIVSSHLSSKHLDGISHLNSDVRGLYINEHIIANGDNFSSNDSITDYLNKELKNKISTTSINCLSRFYKNKETFLRRVSLGYISVLDFKSDKYIDITNRQYEKITKDIRDGKIVNPPEIGMSLMFRRWHSSGNVLLKDNKLDTYILTGNDDGAFFGVELPKKCTTIKAALESLIPPQVKGKPYIRQGEWFMVHVNEKQVPKLEETLCSSSLSDMLSLPILDESSNKHEIRSNDIRVTKDGIFAMNPSISHVDHNEVYMNGWVRFYKNTALRSFSEQGVD